MAVVHPWIKRGVGAMLALVASGLAGLVIYGAILSMSLALPKSDKHPPLRLYSGPFLLQPDLSLVHSHLL